MDERAAEIETIVGEQAEEASRENRRRETPGFRERSTESRRPGDQDALRREDMALLRDLVADSELSADFREAFEDMLRVLRRGRLPLTRRQREHAERAARRVGITVGDPAERNAKVPRGKEVEPPPVLSGDSVRAALEARERAKARAAERARRA